MQKATREVAGNARGFALDRSRAREIACEFLDAETPVDDNCRRQFNSAVDPERDEQQTACGDSLPDRCNSFNYHPNDRDDFETERPSHQGILFKRGHSRHLSKLDLHHKPQEVLIVAIETCGKSSLKSNVVRQSKPDLRDHCTAPLVNVIFELGAESKELRHIVTSARSELPRSVRRG